ncbi:DUF771 domain-containing protein [Ligilactobacillus cholophilus]|uniref:DUF771 domain-containing protein n=1 Tax=Ligilactobacillus cholophilus TaxID=3050131 RepID=UPI0025B25989|nr:DUF771 domain-containing protein [Ligilactobacillus cholophilus]
MKLIKNVPKIINRPRLVVINVEQFEKLKHHDEQGQCWGLKEFKDKLQIKKSLEWIREDLLKPNREEIEAKNGKGWCVFGDGKGTAYRIQPSGARKWLEDNFNKINWD